MDAGRPSATAMAVAVSRGSHRACDEPPWVLDDPYALSLAGPACTTAISRDGPMAFVRPRPSA
jgi:hypothetical protein